MAWISLNPLPNFTIATTLDAVHDLRFIYVLTMSNNGSSIGYVARSRTSMRSRRGCRSSNYVLRCAITATQPYTWQCIRAHAYDVLHCPPPLFSN